MVVAPTTEATTEVMTEDMTEVMIGGIIMAEAGIIMTEVTTEDMTEATHQEVLPQDQRDTKLSKVMKLTGTLQNACMWEIFHTRLERKMVTLLLKRSN